MDDASYLDSWALALHDHAKSTRKMYRETLRHFARTLPEGVSLLDVSRRQCQAYFASLKALGRSQATVRGRWVAMRSFYAWALAEDEIPENPMANVKVEKADPPPPDVPDDANLKKLLKACAGSGLWERRDLAMIRTAAATGLRVGELCALKLTDVDLATRTIIVRHGKGDRARVVRVDPETGAAIDRYLRARGRYRLAHLPDVWLTRFGPMGRSGAQAMLPRRCDQAGVPRLHWHQLRHRFAHQWLAAGGQEGDLARLGGWSDPTVMRRYGSALATERALAAYDEMGGVL